MTVVGVRPRRRGEAGTLVDVRYADGGTKAFTLADLWRFRVEEGPPTVGAQVFLQGTSRRWGAGDMFYEATVVACREDGTVKVGVDCGGLVVAG